jgi:hypothetical protein
MAFNLTPIQIAILIAVIVVGIMVITVIGRIRAAYQPRLPYRVLYYNGRNWWLPPHIVEAILAAMTPSDRAFVERHNEPLQQGAMLAQRDLDRYNAIVAAAITIHASAEPGDLQFFTNQGQALFRRRVSGRR